MKHLFLCILFFCPVLLFSQASTVAISQEKLSLEHAISIAADSSLAALKAQNSFLSGYWRFRVFKAGLLPSLILETTPLQYNRNFVKRYDYTNNIDVYKSQQSFYSSANATMSQAFGLTGGSFYLESDLSYLRNFGVSSYKQYSSVPFRIGYSQSLFGYNSYKWDKKIEPLHYERVKKQLVYDIEAISEQTAQYFFAAALNQVMYHLAKQNLANSDTLYHIGLERYKIGTISESDLLTLKLNFINSRNDLSDALINLKSSSFSLNSYLRLKKEDLLQLDLPRRPLKLFISANDAVQKAVINNPTITEQKENILSAQQNLEKVKRENRFSSTISASIGFNQVGSSLSSAYRAPQQQDIVSLSLSIPILDWGTRKGKNNMARNNLNIVKISAQESEEAFEQEVLLAVEEFNDRQSRIGSEEEAKQIAQQAYEKTRQLFLIGKTNVDAINQAQSRQIEAEINYVTSLKNYWLCYYKIRRLTLYDFATDTTISAQYEQAGEF